MKILFLVSNLNNVGGLEQYNKNLLTALRELEMNISLVELKKSEFLSKLDFIIRTLLKGLFLGPDVVFCTHVNFSPVAYFFRKLFGCKYVVFTHGIDVWNLKEKLKIKALKKAEIVISVSHYTADKLKNQIRELENKIFLLPNTVDEKVFYPKEKSLDLLSQYNLSKNNKIILTVTRLSAKEKYKGYDKVIESLPTIIREFPEARYMIVGSGDDLERVKKIISDLSLKDYVILTGGLSGNLTDYYNLSDVFVMPSRGEGFGIVFLEALACGKPVITGNSDGSKDAVLNGRLGIMVNHDDINEIAEAIVNVFKKRISPSLLNSDFLRSEVLKNYGFDKFKEKVKNLIYVLSR